MVVPAPKLWSESPRRLIKTDCLDSSSRVSDSVHWECGFISCISNKFLGDSRWSGEHTLRGRGIENSLVFIRSGILQPWAHMRTKENSDLLWFSVPVILSFWDALALSGDMFDCLQSGRVLLAI